MSDLDGGSIVLAFSGGLDTSFCVPWLGERHGAEIVTVTVDTGGLDDAARERLRVRALELGAVRHILVDAREAFFEETLCFLIMGNVLRGHLYPLCVGAERSLQARSGGRDRARTERADRRPRLHRRRQRSGAVRGGAAHARSVARDPGPHPRRRVLARGRGGVAGRARHHLAVGARGLFREQRPLGFDHRRQGNHRHRGAAPRVRLGADRGRLRPSARARTPHDPLRARSSRRA